MSKAPPNRPALAPAQTGWLLATGLATMTPLTPHVPGWLAAVAALTLLWRAWLAWRRQALPPRWLLTLLVVAGSGGVAIHFHTLLGQNPGVALLILFLALKQLETRTVRDGLTTVFLAYFLALAQFFYSQAIPAALATVLATLTATATLLSLADHRPAPAALLRQAGALLLQALPFMLLLFVLFPRVQGPLWGLPKDANSALTGMSDTMTAGSIGALSQSDAIAFRVRFADRAQRPAQRQLYWRGPVLSDFDGRTWRPDGEPARAQLPYAEPTAGGVDYDITVEPHGKRWLFALELPGRSVAGTLATHDFQLLAKEPLTTRQRYALRSYPALQAGADDAASLRARALQLPAGSNPRIRQLAAGWRAATRSDAEILALAEAFFLRQGLLYTLSPPLLGEQSADEFLFDTKQGFCEHFANAFAVAMRAAGLPARVVTGYQGGEENPVDGYLTVHQYDAHAWTEVWLAGRGWLRVDPTAISAPTRIDINLAAAVPRGDPLPMLARLDVAWLRDLRFRWDALGNAWNQWVLGYNPERQRQLMRRLGMAEPDWRAMTAWLAALSGGAMLALAAWTLRQRRRRDPAVALWAKLSKRLARRDLACGAAEGPRAYAERVAAALPAAGADVHAMADLYIALRYQRHNPHAPRLIDELRRRVESFQP
jgi:transglutaminase-like putative cysteine protease